MRYFLFFIISFLATSVGAQHGFPDRSERPPTMKDLFAVKETFKYEVKYGFFKLGHVEVTLLSDSVHNGREMKHLYTEIRSNPRVPFLGTEIDQFNSLFFVNEQGLPVTETYWKDNIDEGEYNEIRYSFDRLNGVVTYKEEDDTRDTLALEEPATAGHIIFYFSRLFAGSDSSSIMPVYVTKRAGRIYMDNPKKIEMRKYAPFDGKVKTYLSRGRTENIDGPFGFSGDFRAWFLADDLRVPLEARVKVFLGNAIVRLIEYEREDL